MTSPSCDKLVKSDGSIKTSRATKLYRAVKKRQRFSFKVFNYSKYYHPTPSQNDSAICHTTEKEWQESQIREGIKAKYKGLSDSCKIAQEIWQRCCKVPKFNPVHIRAEMLDNHSPVWKCSANVLFFIIVKLLQLFITTRVFLNFGQKRFFRNKIDILVSLKISSDMAKSDQIANSVNIPLLFRMRQL